MTKPLQQLNRELKQQIAQQQNNLIIKQQENDQLKVQRDLLIADFDNFIK